jgi:uncharacterized protein YjbI with pentapeptide repeats
MEGMAADLVFADLKDADLGDADLRHADLRGADMSNADLRGADVRTTSIRHPHPERATREERDREAAVFTHARYDGSTRWPGDLNLEEAGAVR